MAVYLDDIVIYNESMGDYLNHFRLVFVKLRKNELYEKREV